jgi:hypothetical protein
LNIEISLGLIDDLREAVQLASIPGCTTNILQLEDSLDNLGNRQLCIGHPGAVVEPGTVEVVRRLRPAGVDGSRLREFQRLVVVMTSLKPK